ncbi:hypothetical protein PGT21_036335 [Puccinia graminis f. sp. tritici]|uniref:Uncharacterized protein n=1 Tax=Puccinia graminis f. sp. tritici TaxID=56615 RepID=A0A5B0QQA0_PUCGR|nr:hypothetical protein PGT21_036335 [Puccinia graminis f. sp. tritici]KAA1123059.1 hypothetical protein PGTUg99_016053 [Puccinia graminis f. sp. tritici]
MNATSPRTISTSCFEVKHGERVDQTIKTDGIAFSKFGPIYTATNFTLSKRTAKIKIMSPRHS